MYYRLPFLIMAVSLFISCEKAETPSYLHIEQIDLKVRPFNGNPEDFEGTPDHNITDAWVYLNDQLIGTWELPATVPIISSGNQKITVIAGIKNNGIGATRVDYPFFDLYSANLTLIPDETIDFREDPNSVLINGHYCPFVQYFPSGLVFWNERFEDPGTQFEAALNSPADINITQNALQVFNYNPGNNSQGSGFIYLNTDSSFFEIISTHEFNPEKGRKVYLEMNYKSNCVLQVGVYEKSPNVVKVYGKGINPNNDWSKIYIELTDEIARRQSATSYALFIEGILSSGQTTGEVFLDNIKIIYPE
jgi:hypothetical protein